MTGFLIAIWVIHILFTLMGFASTVFICLIHIIHFIITVATQSVGIGYILETVRMELQGYRSVMPGWKNKYKQYFWNGTVIQAIIFLYLMAIAAFLLICLIVMSFFVPLDLSLFPALAIKENFSWLDILITTVIFLLPGFASIAFILIFPFIVVRYAETNNVLSAFNVIYIAGRLMQNILPYCIAIIASTLLLIVTVIINLILCLTVIGLVIGAFAQFIFAIIIFNMFAQAYKQANTCHTNNVTYPDIS
jgi:hypothetical protein